MYVYYYILLFNIIGIICKIFYIHNFLNIGIFTIKNKDISTFELEK